MKYLMFAIKDTVTGEFSSPRLAHNDTDVLRQFNMLTNKVENASDYQCYHVGIFDTELGVVDPIVDGDTKQILPNVFVATGEFKGGVK